MGVVGKATKQPKEVEVYALRYTDDLGASDSLASAYTFIMVNRLAGALVEYDDDATVTAAGKRYLLTDSAVLTLSGMSVDDRVYVTNGDDTDAAEIASADLVDGAATLTLTALHGVVLVKTEDGWITEATVRATVDVADDRVRNRMSGGYDGVTYKIETTTTTADGRVLEDEILVKVKEE